VDFRDVGVRGPVFADAGGEQIAINLRNNISAAYMGYSLTVALTQPIGYLNSAERLGGRRVFAATKELFVNPKQTAQFVWEKSEYMAQRHNTLNVETASLNQYLAPSSRLDALIDKTVGGKAAAPTKRFYQAGLFFATNKLQALVDIPTWLAAYQKALSENFDDATAVQIANQMVSDIQGGGKDIEQARVQRSSALLKMLTPFYTAFGAQYNRYYLLGAEGIQKRDKLAQNVGRLVFLLAAPPLYMALYGELKSALKGEDDEDLTVADRFWAEFIANMFGGIIGVRELVPGIQSLADVNNFAGTYRGPASTAVLFNAIDMLKQAGQVRGDGADALDAPLLKSIINLAGAMTGLPSVAINRLIFGGYDWIAEDGNMFNVLLGPSK
jgi:hypothetical protein